MVIRERVRRCGRGGASGKVVVRACDPELTAAYADRPLRDFAVERNIMGQPCPLRCSLPRGRDELVHRTTDAVQSSLLRSPGFCSSRKACKNAAVLKEHVAFQLSVCHSRLGPFLACQKISNPLLNLSAGSTDRSAGRLPVVLLQV